MHLQFLTSYKTEYKHKIIETVTKALEAGVDSIQFCWDDLNTITEVGYTIRSLCSEYSTPFIVNNHVDVAIALNADGVHLGPKDMCIKEARAVLPKGTTIGYTINSLKQLDNDYYKYSDYLGVGPIFTTKTNTDSFDGSIHLGALKHIKAYTDMDIIAIGGINTSNTTSIYNQDINSIAVIGAIYESQDISSTVKQLKGITNDNNRTNRFN